MSFSVSPASVFPLLSHCLPLRFFVSSFFLSSASLLLCFYPPVNLALQVSSTLILISPLCVLNPPLSSFFSCFIFTPHLFSSLTLLCMQRTVFIEEKSCILCVVLPCICKGLREKSCLCFRVFAEGCREPLECVSHASL